MKKLLYMMKVLNELMDLHKELLDEIGSEREDYETVSGMWYDLQNYYIELRLLCKKHYETFGG